MTKKHHTYLNSFRTQILWAIEISDSGIGKFNENSLYLPGICFDIEFDEFARVYRNEGCNFLVYPAAFPIYTGELHWELYQRARAADTQSYVTMVSASRDYTNPFVNWGYTTLVDPWARVIKKAGEDEEIIKADLGEMARIYCKF